ncbi:MAG: YbjN domain-containing protein [Deltaproteobacteria bacterium]|nr:MAG: YbjN domain-containing protein [Deltaproteobacteria bacterium]
MARPVRSDDAGTAALSPVSQGRQASSARNGPPAPGLGRWIARAAGDSPRVAGGPMALLTLLLALATPAHAGELLTEVTAYLNGADIAWQGVPGRSELVQTAIPGPSGQGYLVLVHELEEQNQLLLYAVHEKKVPEHRRPAVAEFITRANYGLPIGNFEMDFDDGEFRFKTSVDMEGGKLTAKMAENLLVLNLRSMDRYAAGAMKVAFDNAKPAAAIAAIEGQ